MKTSFFFVTRNNDKFLRMNLRDATKIINKADTGITLNKSEQKLAELMLHAPIDQNNVSAKLGVTFLLVT